MENNIYTKYLTDMITLRSFGALRYRCAVWGCELADGGQRGKCVSDTTVIDITTVRIQLAGHRGQSVGRTRHAPKMYLYSQGRRIRGVCLRVWIWPTLNPTVTLTPTLTLLPRSTH